MSTYVFVANGVITTPDSGWIWNDSGPVSSSAFSRPYAVGNVSLGADASDAELAALGVYKLVVTERGAAPSPEYQPTTGALVVDTENGIVTRTDGWREPTSEERLAYNRTLWTEQAQARKDRAANAALAEPDSDDPQVLRRKLNAALHLISR